MQSLLWPLRPSPLSAPPVLWRVGLVHPLRVQQQRRGQQADHGRRAALPAGRPAHDQAHPGVGRLLVLLGADPGVPAGALQPGKVADVGAGGHELPDLVCWKGHHSRAQTRGFFPELLDLVVDDEGGADDKGHRGLHEVPCQRRAGAGAVERQADAVEADQPVWDDGEREGQEQDEGAGVVRQVGGGVEGGGAAAGGVQVVQDHGLSVAFSGVCLCVRLFQLFTF